MRTKTIEVVGEAAVALLQRAGRRVTLGPPDLRCCGRPLISNGLLDRAVAYARHNVERLVPLTSVAHELPCRVPLARHANRPILDSPIPGPT